MMVRGVAYSGSGSGLLALAMVVRGVAYSGWPYDGDSFPLCQLDEFLCLVLWDALSNDGNGAELHSSKINMDTRIV